jgi:acetyltransferase-like isoleucine patch superfamily enzyme
VAIISGGVKIGKGTYIGVGAIIRDGITIGEDSVIGAGAVVVKDVAKNLTVVGNPAKTPVK